MPTKKLKISDCITQAQPFLEKEVLDSDGKTVLAKLKALSFQDQMKANSYAIQVSKLDIEKLKTLDKDSAQVEQAGISGTALMLKSLELAITEWIFEDKITAENINIVSQVKPKIFNKIFSAYYELRENYDALSKNS